MAAEQAPIFEVHSGGTPEAYVAGMAISLKLYIWGPPESQARPRGRVVAAPGKKPFVQFYEDGKSKQWRAEVIRQLREQIPLIDVQGGTFSLPARGRVLMGIRFNLKKPASYPKSVVHHTKKPDIDNLSKHILDGLVQANVIEDDSWVTDLTLSKRYETPDHPEGVEIDLTVIREQV